MTNLEFKAIRQRLGLTQAQLAIVLGYGYANNIAHFEQGRRPVPTLLALLMQAYASGYRPPDWPV